MQQNPQSFDQVENKLDQPEPSLNLSSDEEDTHENVESINNICDQILQLNSEQQLKMSKSQKWDILKLRMNKGILTTHKMKTLQDLTDPLMDKEVQPYRQFIPIIIKLQSFIRMRSLSKIYKIKIKRARYRINILKELLSTEEIYVNDLNTLNELILQKISSILNNVLLEPSQALILNDMIQSLEKIIATNQSILIVFQIRMVCLQFNFTFFKDFDSCFVPQFSSYFNYCQKFQAFTDTIKQVRINKSQIDEIISKAEKDPSFRGLDLLSILVKPIQRLPKYILLIKDLLKHTEVTHIDFKYTQQSLVKFEQINEENNSKMNSYIHMCKLKELDKLIVQTQDKKIDIVKQNREFVMEESLNILNNSSDQSVIVYFFTDLILLTDTDGGQTQLIQFIEIDEQSICKNVPDQKYFLHLFSIKGKDHSITFICPSKENKKTIVNQIQAYLKDIRKKFFENFYTLHPKKQCVQSTSQNSVEYFLIPVTVSTIGTEVRQISDQYTIYIVEITVEQIQKRLYVRYSEIREVRNLVEKEFGLTDLPKLKNSFFVNNQKTKLVEQRKILIEDVLQIILNNVKIQEKGEFILKHLGLPHDLFMNLQGRSQSEIFQGKKDRVSLLSEEQTHMMQSKLLGQEILLRQNSSAIILQKAKQELDDNQKTFRNRNSIQSKGSSLSKVQIMLMDGSVLDMEIDEMTTGGRLVLDIGQQIQLNHSLDFRLFIVEKNTTLKSLDSDVLIQKLLQEMTKSGYKQQKLVLHFRKYIYLINKFEEEDFNSEPIRLKLIVFQILDDIRQFQYNLSFMQYCLMTSVSLFLKDLTLFSRKGETIISFNLIQQHIPKKILDTHQKHVWNINVLNCIALLKNEIRIYIDNHKKEKPDGQVDDLIRQTLYVVVMQRMWSHPLYGIIQFQVEIYKQTLKDIKVIHNETFPVQMILGINMKGVSLYTQELYQQKRSYTHNQIIDVKVFPLSIILTFDKDTVSYRLNSNQSFQIDQLMKEFITLNNLINVEQNTKVLE